MNAFLCASPEEGEELREGSDPHSVHELAGPRRSRGGAAAPQTEAPRQRFQEFLQWPHRRPLQVRVFAVCVHARINVQKIQEVQPASVFAFYLERCWRVSHQVAFDQRW